MNVPDISFRAEMGDGYATGVREATLLTLFYPTHKVRVTLNGHPEEDVTFIQDTLVKGESVEFTKVKMLWPSEDMTYSRHTLKSIVILPNNLLYITKSRDQYTMTEAEMIQRMEDNKKNEEVIEL
jgi:hypothetical protein